MFQLRRHSFQRQKQNANHGATTHNNTASNTRNNNRRSSTIISPLDELSNAMTRMEYLIQKTKERISLSPPPHLTTTDKTSSKTTSNPMDELYSSQSSIKQKRRSILNYIPRCPPLFHRQDSCSLSSSVNSSSSGYSNSHFHGCRHVSSNTNATTMTTETTTLFDQSEEATSSSSLRAASPKAIILSFDPRDEEEFVELLRRIAEIVARSEKRIARDKKRREATMPKETVVVGGNNDNNDNNNGLPPEQEEELPDDDDDAVFDYFCERNGLALIVGVVTGKAFDIINDNDYNDNNDDTETMTTTTTTTDDERDETIDGFTTSTTTMPSNIRISTKPTTKLHNNNKLPHPKSKPRYLPPLSIATQSVQSMAILIQNISRMTSLYFLLSNNHVNELIGLPLELYTEASRVTTLSRSSSSRHVVHVGTMDDGTNELANHFVSFLKVLSMRIDTETLQFFLSYAVAASSSSSTTERDDATAAAAGTTIMEVDFSLYVRALEFCSAHRDYFVRVTAMNICLNTLRLVTLPTLHEGDDDVFLSSNPQDSPYDDYDDGSNATTSKSLLSPQRLHSFRRYGNVSHDDVDLPTRDRSIIARHVCDPSRVRELVSPILSRLEQLRGDGEESVLLMMDGSGRKGKEDGGRRRRMETVLCDLQDELLMLDDILKVGIPSVNKYTIEILLVIFIYPLLLQPLLFYHDRLLRSHNPPSISSSFSSFHIPLPLPDNTSPVKTAIITLTTIFHTVSNKELLRLLVSIILHPRRTMTNSNNVLSKTTTTTTTTSKDDDDDDDSNPHRSVLLSFLRGREKGWRELRRSSVRLVHAAIFSMSGDASFFKTVLMGDDDDDDDDCEKKEEDVIDYHGTVVMGDYLNWFLGEDDSNGEEMSIRRWNFKNGKGLRRGLRNTIDIVASLSIATSVIVVNRGMKQITYDSAAAHALLGLLSTGGGNKSSNNSNNNNTMARQIAHRILSVRCRRAWRTFREIIIPSLLLSSTSMDDDDDNDNNDRQRRRCDELMDEIFQTIIISSSDEKGNDKSVINELAFVKSDYQKNQQQLLAARRILEVWIKVTEESSVMSACDVLCEHEQQERQQWDEDQGDVEEEDEERMERWRLQCAARSALACLKLDAFTCLVGRDESSSSTRSSTSSSTSDTSFPSLKDDFVFNDDGYILAPLSPLLRSSLLFPSNRPAADDNPNLNTGGVVSLVGKTKFSCVCQVSDEHSHHFEVGRVWIVDQAGMKWQSLYLVLNDPDMMLVEPVTRTTMRAFDEGTILTSCRLMDLSVEFDTPSDNNDDKSNASKLIFQYSSLESTIPRIFTPISSCQKRQRQLNNNNVVDDETTTNTTKSQLSIWFRNRREAHVAYDALRESIAIARSRRGRQLRKALILNELSYDGEDWQRQEEQQTQQR